MCEVEAHFQGSAGKETTCPDSFSPCGARGGCYSPFAMPSADSIPASQRMRRQLRGEVLPRDQPTSERWHLKPPGFVPPPSACSCPRGWWPRVARSPLPRRLLRAGVARCARRACAREGGANIGKSLPGWELRELRPRCPRAGLGCHRYRVF